ncbi:MAG: hypothetical protein V1825_00350 [Candidatus Falkowbacteria bacterium]
MHKRGGKALLVYLSFLGLDFNFKKQLLINSLCHYIGKVLTKPPNARIDLDGFASPRHSFSTTAGLVRLTRICQINNFY